MTIQLALALFKLVNAIFQAIQEQRWYQAGKTAADAAANAEQQKRIDLANAAGADAEHIANGGLRDPNDRDALP